MNSGNVENTPRDYDDMCLHYFVYSSGLIDHSTVNIDFKSGGGGVLPYMGYMGMCRCEGYGFQAVYSRIGYINQSVWV